jgi:hypothetical protein
MRKTLFALPCMAAIALAAFVGMRTLERNKNINATLLMANVEALTEEEGESPTYIIKSCYMNGDEAGDAYGYICSKGTVAMSLKDCPIVMHKVKKFSLQGHCIKVQ